jgi:hypothetical protein
MDASDFVIVISKAMTRTMVLIGGLIITMVGTVAPTTTPTQVLVITVISVIIDMLLMFELQELVLQSPDFEQQIPKFDFETIDLPAQANDFTFVSGEQFALRGERGNDRQQQVVSGDAVETLENCHQYAFGRQVARHQVVDEIGERFATCILGVKRYDRHGPSLSPSGFGGGKIAARSLAGDRAVHVYKACCGSWSSIGASLVAVARAIVLWRSC